MFEYTKNAIFSTFDLLKKVLFFFELIFQIFYILFIAYRLFAGEGILVMNIILFVLSLAFSIYYISTYPSLNSQSVSRTKNVIKRIYTWAKRALNLVIIIIGLVAIIQSATPVDPLTIMMSGVLVISLVLSLLFDFLVYLINKQYIIIKTSIELDIEEFKEAKGFKPFVAKKILGIKKDKNKPEKVVEEKNLNLVQKMLAKRNKNKNKETSLNKDVKGEKR